MNTISPLDIRVAVLAYPLVAREEEPLARGVPRPIVPYRGDERIVSLFQNSPKAFIEPSRSKIPPLIRKGQFLFIKIVEILKTLLQEKEQSSVLSDIASPRELAVPQLPYPPFKMPRPPRFFWHQASADEYTPGCLISEAKEELPATVYNSASICAYTRCALPRKGVLQQDAEGFVYLELADTYVSELLPLLHDAECEGSASAHVPVLLPQEWNQKKGWGEIDELGKSFSFEVNRLSSLKPKRWPGVKKAYFLRLKSAELEQLREKYLLPSRIRGHEFHVAIAYKTQRASESAQEREVFRLNVSCTAA